MKSFPQIIDYQTFKFQFCVCYKSSSSEPSNFEALTLQFYSKPTVGLIVYNLVVLKLC